MKQRAKAQRGVVWLYAPVLAEAERVAMESAAEVVGLHEEIALLRVKLRTLIQQRPEELPLLLKTVELMVRAVSAQYRTSRKAETDLFDSVVGVLQGVGEIMGPREAPNNGRR